MVEQVLFASANEKTARPLADLARRHLSLPLQLATTGAQARRQMGELDIAVAIIDAPLPDEPGINLAVELARGTAAGVLLLVRCDAAEEISAKVEPYGVFVVEKPLHTPFYLRTLNLAHACSYRLKTARSETVRLRNQLLELRLVGRAKCALIEHRQFTEPQAHHFIEKQAMDRRVTKGEIAKDILAACEPKQREPINNGEE